MIIPLYFKHDIVGLNFSEFKQCVGRVGRFGKEGFIDIIYVKIDNKEFDKLK